MQVIWQNEPDWDGEINDHASDSPPLIFGMEKYG
jgi:hypothetical protein